MSTLTNLTGGWKTSKQKNKIFKNIWVYSGLIFFLHFQLP